MSSSATVEEEEKAKTCTFFKKSGKRSAVRKRKQPSSDEGISYKSGSSRELHKVPPFRSYNCHTLAFAFMIMIR